MYGHAPNNQLPQSRPSRSNQMQPNGQYPIQISPLQRQSDEQQIMQNRLHSQQPQQQPDQQAIPQGLQNMFQPQGIGGAAGHHQMGFGSSANSNFNNHHDMQSPHHPAAQMQFLHNQHQQHQSQQPQPSLGSFQPHAPQSLLNQQRQQPNASQPQQHQNIMHQGPPQGSNQQMQMRAGGSGPGGPQAGGPPGPGQSQNNHHMMPFFMPPHMQSPFGVPPSQQQQQQYGVPQGPQHAQPPGHQDIRFPIQQNQQQNLGQKQDIDVGKDVAGAAAAAHHQQMIHHQYYQQHNQMHVQPQGPQHGHNHGLGGGHAVVGHRPNPNQLNPLLVQQHQQLQQHQSQQNNIPHQQNSGSSNIRMAAEPHSDAADEFDEDFHRNRPVQHISGNLLQARGHSGLSQQLSNEEEIQQQAAIWGIYINPCDNNYKNKKKIGGLNENRKGKITQIDRDRLQQQNFSLKNERIRNQMFKKQPQECVQRSLQNKKAQLQQFEQEKHNNEMRVREMLQMVDSNMNQIEMRNRQFKDDIHKAFINAQQNQQNQQNQQQQQQQLIVQSVVPQQRSLSDQINGQMDQSENYQRNNARLNNSMQLIEQKDNQVINSSSFLNDNNNRFSDQQNAPVSADQMIDIMKIVQEVKQELRQEFRNKMRNQRSNSRDLEEQKEHDNNDGSIFSSNQSDKQNSQSNMPQGSHSIQNSGSQQNLNSRSGEKAYNQNQQNQQQRITSQRNKKEQNGNNQKMDSLRNSNRKSQQFNQHSNLDSKIGQGLENVSQISYQKPQSMRINLGNQSFGSNGSSNNDQQSEFRDQVGHIMPNNKKYNKNGYQINNLNFDGNQRNQGQSNQQINPFADRHVNGSSFSDLFNQDDSADEESEKLRASYETYGLMLVQRNQKKKQDQRVQNLRSIYENSSERGSSSERGKKPKLNKLKSSSLRNFKVQRRGSVVNQQSLQQQNDEQQLYHQMSLNAGLASNRKLRKETGQTDHLLFQIEDQRRSLFDGIIDIIQAKNNRKQKINHIVNKNLSNGVGSGSSQNSFGLQQDSQQNQELDLDMGGMVQNELGSARYQHLNKNDRILCKALDEINVEDFSIEHIVSLSKEDKKKLLDMLTNYKKVQQNQNKYQNLDCIENESNSQSSELLSDFEQPSKNKQTKKKMGFGNFKVPRVEGIDRLNRHQDQRLLQVQQSNRMNQAQKQNSQQRKLEQQLKQLQQQININSARQSSYKRHRKYSQQDDIKHSRLQMYVMERGGKRGSSAFIQQNEQLEEYDSEQLSQQSNRDHDNEDKNNMLLVRGGAPNADDDEDYEDKMDFSQQPLDIDKKEENEGDDDDDEEEDDEGSEHQIAADLQSMGGYAPSIGQIGRRDSIQSLDPAMIKKFALKYNPFMEDNQSQRSRKPFFDDNQSMKSIKSIQSIRSRKPLNKPQPKNLQEQMLLASQKESENFFSKDDKVRGLELEYNMYLQQYQATFVLSCQQLNFELIKVKNKGYDIRKLMLEQNNFASLQDQIQQDPMFYNSQTIVMDIENTLVSKLDVRNAQELQNLKQLDNYQLDYVIIKKHQNKGKDRHSQSATPAPICCPDMPNCFCDTMVYQIRPYTYEFLRAIQPFFEIVVFSRMHHKIIENIINHIESVLNKPIKQYLERQKGQPRRSRFGRGKKLPDVKLYFQFIFHQRQYIHIKEIDRYVENLLLLTKNRKQEDLIYISSNPFRIINALNENFLALPVIPFETNNKHEFQLCLLENYILKYRHHKEMRDRLRRDFTFLLNQVKEKQDFDDSRSCGSVRSRRNPVQKRESNFDAASMGSFGPRVIEKTVKKKSNQQAYSKFRPANSKANNKQHNSFLQISKFSQQQEEDGDDLEDYEEEDDESISDLDDNSVQAPSPNSANGNHKSNLQLPQFSNAIMDEDPQNQPQNTPNTGGSTNNKKSNFKNFFFSNNGEALPKDQKGIDISEEIDANGFFKEQSTPRKCNSSPIEVGQMQAVMQPKSSDQLSANQEVNRSQEESENSRTNQNH